MRQRGGERRAAPSGGMEPRIGVRRERARQSGGSAPQPPPPRRRPRARPRSAPRPSAAALRSLPCGRSGTKVGGRGPRWGGGLGGTGDEGPCISSGGGRGEWGCSASATPLSLPPLGYSQPGEVTLVGPGASGRDAPLGKGFVPARERLVLLLRTYLLPLGCSAVPAPRGAEHKARGSRIVQSWDTPGSRRRDRGSSLRFQPCPYFRVYLWVRR